MANLKNLPCSAEEWSKGGPYRFYYEEAYISIDKKFTAAPSTTTRSSKCAGSKTRSNLTEKITEEAPKTWPYLSKPLRSLDIFAGCGGELVYVRSVIR